MQPEETRSPSWVFQSFGSCTSVMFLALVSLERVYTVLWPLLHRVTRMRAYVFSIVTVWGAELCIAGLSLLTEYHAQVDILYSIVASDLLIVSLIIMCVSYLSIRSRLNYASPNLHVQEPHKKSMVRNARLSKTLFIVVALSLICWLPAFVVFSIKIFCWQCFPPFSLWLITVLHLSNSMVNPFLYSFRMPIFKHALKKLWKKPGKKSQITTCFSSSAKRNLRNLQRTYKFGKLCKPLQLCFTFCHFFWAINVNFEVEMIFVCTIYCSICVTK